MARYVAALLALAPPVYGAAALPCSAPTILGFFTPACDAAGNLLPPATFNHSLQAAMDASVRFYDAAPLSLPDSHGLPPYAWATFMDGYLPTSFDIIAGMQDGMGILGYVKYARRAAAGRGGNATAAVAAAQYLGDYLTLWANTPPTGTWANVTRSTGWNIEWPLSTAAQGDLPFGVNTIETDKVALAGYALLELHNLTGDAAFLQQSLRNARALAAAQSDGNATHAPWPFRVDSVTGAALNGRKSSDTVWALRLFRALVAAGYAEFNVAAQRLWRWVADVQLPTADPTLPGAASHWVNFFEDKDATADDNRCVDVARERDASSVSAAHAHASASTTHANPGKPARISPAYLPPYRQSSVDSPPNRISHCRPYPRYPQ